MTGAAHDRVSDAAAGRQTTTIACLGLAAGVAALLGVSCCVLPLALAMLGLGGAWLAHLGVFVAYGPYLLAGAGAAVVAGWTVAWRRGASRTVYVLLATATIAVAAALLIRLYETQLNRWLGEIWRAARP